MRLLILMIFSLFTTSSIAQSTKLFHRARIDLKGKNISDLNRLGIETDHGILIPKRSLECDYSEYELNLISKAGFEYDILIEDVIKHYQNPNRPSELVYDYSRSGNCDFVESCVISEFETPRNYSGGSMGGHKTYTEMLLALDSMTMLYPDLITTRLNIDSDTTFGGNSIFYLKISDNPNQDETEPQVLYTALHHAREPNGMSQMLFYMWYVLENYETDPEIKAIVDNNEMYFIPCVNPDGYQLNEANQPSGGGLWRKNIRKNEDGQLKGVDLNRNYGYFWGFDNQGSSGNENSQTYRGESAFSEPETQAVKNFCESKNILIALNYHTYGDLLIHPWGYNDAPTDEDALFKTIGAEMSHENCFKLGTGTETVGYTVNGDSDDWMYGEETTKNKIYSLTPEVGPSFWPPQQDILDLNKSCMAMNITTAQLTGNLYDIQSVTTSPVREEVKTIIFDLHKLGLGQGLVAVTITPLSNNIIANPKVEMFDIPTGVSTPVFYTIEYDASLADGDLIEIKVVIEGSGPIVEKDFSFTYFKSDLQTKLTEVTDDITFWTKNGDWNTTNEHAFEGDVSLTDSPFNNYRQNATTVTTLKETINLTEAAYAEISFAARWEIENNYDYAMVMASRDSINFTPLCGAYTNLGTTDQILGEPLYDGFQTDWIKETVSLQDFLGEPKVWIRISMNSDGFLEQDGFYIDDIKVNTIEEAPSSIDNEMLDNIRIYPNPTSDIVTISGLDNISNIQVSIFDISGRRMLISNKTTLDISSYKSGIYTMIIQNENNRVSRKVIKF